MGINIIVMLILTLLIPSLIRKNVDRNLSLLGISISILLYWVGAFIYSDTNVDLLISIIFGAMIITETYIDYYTQDIIPSYIYGAVIMSGLIYIVFERDLLTQIINVAIGFFGYFVLYLLARWYYKEEAFGFGDVLFIAGIAFFLPRHFLIVTMLMPFYIALIHLIVLKVCGHELGKTLKIPFGPYMGVAAILMHFGGSEILGWLKTIYIFLLG